MPTVYSGFTLKSLNLGENIINLGKNCLNIRKGVGTKLLKNKIKNKINLIKCESNYGLNVWDMTLNSKVDAFKSFTLEDSLPCAFAVSGEYRFGSFLNSLRKHRLYWARERTAEIGHRFIPYRSSLDFDDIAEPLKLKFFDTQSELAHGITMRFKRSITQSMHLMGKTMFNPDLALSSAITRSKIKTREFFVKRIHNSAKLSDLRSNMYYDALVAKDYFRALRRGRSYPMFDVAKRSTLLGHMYRSIRETVATTFIGDQYERHPAAQSLYLKKYLNTTINIERFEGWKTGKKTHNTYARFYKTVWRYFKLKLERFFYKKMGIRMHVWFMNIWDIFMTGVDSYWRWFKFEDQKIFAMTRKGQRYLIEGREEAKFYLRSMALTLTFGGGVKLFINKVTTLLRQYRNNWAFITYTMESLRLCGNFFWFRFFLNYKVTLQGKIGGILRAAKKSFKKGDVTIEDRSAVVVHHRTFPTSKFGVYCLGFWLQYRVPNLIGTFDELEYIDTMRVLLSMYSIPWLSTRLTEIIEAILREQEIKKQIKFSQYNRRQRARGILAAEFKLHARKTKFKKKVQRKQIKRKV